MADPNTADKLKTDQDAPLSAYEKAASGGDDPRCIPQTLDGPPPVGGEIVYPGYNDVDQANWRFLYNRQTALLPGRACQAYLHGVELLDMRADAIPALAELSHNMEMATGWKVARIPGLLHEKDFFYLLANRLFPSTDYIRQSNELDYTPAPDCFHDIFGHMPLLTNPAFADFYQLFGIAAGKAQGVQRNYMERLHWFTVEFGLIKDPAGRRIFGAGILSSKGEVEYSLSANGPKVRPFDTATVSRQDYDVWHMQELLFELESFEDLVDKFQVFARAEGLL